VIRLHWDIYGVWKWKWLEPWFYINTNNDYHTGYQDWLGISDPVSPAIGDLRVYAKPVVGRMLPKWKGPSGLDTPFQPAFLVIILLCGISGNLWCYDWRTTDSYNCWCFNTSTVTNRYTSLRRSVFTSATGVNTMNSLRSEATFF
jgi:hypothetical protein